MIGPSSDATRLRLELGLGGRKERSVGSESVIFHCCMGVGSLAWRAGGKAAGWEMGEVGPAGGAECSWEHVQRGNIIVIEAVN